MSQIASGPLDEIRMMLEVLYDSLVLLKDATWRKIIIKEGQRTLARSKERKMGLEIPLEGSCAQGVLDPLLIHSSISRAGQNTSGSFLTFELLLGPNYAICSQTINAW